MKIGDRLKKMRVFLGLTQTEMSEGIMTESFYSKVERNVSKIKINDLLAILNKNGITLEDFFGVRDTVKNLDEGNSLKEAVLTLPRDDARNFMKLIFKEGREDTITNKRQIADLSIKYLERCYEENWVLEGKETISFIEKFPPYPILAIDKLTAQYYRALFEHNKMKIIEIKEVLKFNGYTALAEKLPNLDSEEE